MTAKKQPPPKPSRRTARPTGVCGRFEFIESGTADFPTLCVRFHAGRGSYRGEGSSDWADRLDARIKKSCDARPADVLFDVGDMQHLDVFSIRTLVETYRLTERAERITAVVSSKAKHLDRLRILKLDYVFPIYASVEEAAHDLYVDSIANAQRAFILRSGPAPRRRRALYVYAGDFQVSEEHYKGARPSSSATYYLVLYAPKSNGTRQGEDPSICGHLEDRIAPLMEKQPSDLICDFRKLPSLDAYLLGFLYSRLEASRGIGARFALDVDDGPAAHVLHAVRFDEKVPVYQSLDTALAELAKAK